MTFDIYRPGSCLFALEAFVITGVSEAVEKILPTRFLSMSGGVEARNVLIGTGSTVSP
jgi:hypothetical protein